MIVQLASKLYLEKGFEETLNKDICDILGISAGNLTFHYPQREHILTEFIRELCDFQWRTIRMLQSEDTSPLLALCIEFATLVAIADNDDAMRDILTSAYCYPLPLAVIRENDTKKTQEVFAEYCPDWTEQQFSFMENIYSGIEYGMFSSVGGVDETLDERVSQGLHGIMKLYNVPWSVRERKIQKIMDMDYRSLGEKIFTDFKEYITAVTYMAVETRRQEMLEKSAKTKS